MDEKRVWNVTISCFKVLILSEKLSLKADLLSLSPSDLRPSSQSAASFIQIRRLCGVFRPTLFSSSFRYGSESLRISSSISPPVDTSKYPDQRLVRKVSSLPLWELTPPAVGKIENHTPTNAPHLLAGHSLACIPEHSTINHDHGWQTCHRSAERAVKTLEVCARNSCSLLTAVAIHTAEVLLVCSAMLERRIALCVVLKQWRDFHSSGHMRKLQRHLCTPSCRAPYRSSWLWLQPRSNLWCLRLVQRIYFTAWKCMWYISIKYFSTNYPAVNAPFKCICVCFVFTVINKGRKVRCMCASDEHRVRSKINIFQRDSAEESGLHSPVLSPETGQKVVSKLTSATHSNRRFIFIRLSSWLYWCPSEWGQQSWETPASSWLRLRPFSSALFVRWRSSSSSLIRSLCCFTDLQKTEPRPQRNKLFLSESKGQTVGGRWVVLLVCC